MQGIKIGNFSLEVPVIQGGMAVNVSRASLVAAVSNAGGLGVIGASGLSADEVVYQIRKARELTRGPIGVNVMVAVSNFTKVVEAAIKEKVDVILAGAGFSKDIFKLAHEGGVNVVPVVSSAKVAILAEKLGAVAVVVEGTEAGGHLGTDRPVRDILPEVIDAVSIPVFAAGGLTDGRDMADVMRRGAAGVQMGSRFVLSEECDVSPVFKEVYLGATEKDIILINSPVGLPGRAIRTPLSEKIMVDDKSIRPKSCSTCLKKCAMNFCILTALKKASEGDLENGLFFSGACSYKIKDILPARDIIDRIVGDADQYLAAWRNKPHAEKLRRTADAA